MDPGATISAGIFVISAVFGAGGAIVVLRLLGRDVNGLGKKQSRMIACDLRCIAEEDPISKTKLMHLANLLEGK